MKRLFLTLLLGLLFLPLHSRAEIRLAPSPLIVNVRIEPGENYSGEVTVYNNSSHDLELGPSVIDFRDGGQGRAALISPEEIERSIEEGKEFLLSQWVEMDARLRTAPAGGSATFPYRISIPENAGPGGKYAAFVVGARPPEADFSDFEDEAGSVLRISPSVGTLFLITVGGEVVEEARIRSFFTPERYYRRPEVPFHLAIENLGNTHIIPRGEIKIYDYRDRHVDTLYVRPRPGFGNILPGSTRSWDLLWEGEDKLTELGKYRAELTLYYGTESIDLLTDSVEFWIIPVGPIIQFLAVVLTVFILLILFSRSLAGYFRKIRHKRKNRL